MVSHRLFVLSVWYFLHMFTNAVSFSDDNNIQHYACLHLLALPWECTKNLVTRGRGRGWGGGVCAGEVREPILLYRDIVQQTFLPYSKELRLG